MLMAAFGCSSKFQVFDTEANNSVVVDGSWSYENDSVRITYWFWGERGLVSFSIFNKCDKPIYVDWKNSSFILNENKLDYWVDEEVSQLASYYGGYYYSGPLIKPGYTANQGIQAGVSTTRKPERITFIPPKSYYFRSQFYLWRQGYVMNFNAATVQYANGKKESKANRIRENNFELAGTPLKFRNYVAFSFSESSSSFFFVDNGFFVYSVKEMNASVFRGKPITDRDGATSYPYPFRAGTSFYIEIKPDGINP